ncbi:Threonine dehydrogenase [Caenispirillum salinarum AK4]|uniref:Threonine dehydrogenase n=1 Tax=Caenispirillum salinarum AK4 TaxID=1238182 RepID=K9GST3_9PROT|nr:zinc-dependent alcohol dehydrogenase [Caenispirillum salinarum]EKV28202.1 Threonine dehydrogenase [Caenispirillum salinarum AK4]
MKAVVFHDIGDVRLEDVPDPSIKQPTDAIVRLTASAICGTDLHMVRGSLPGMVPGTVLGHEGVGVVEEIGPNVRNLKKGDRVVIPSTISCGSCNYCRAGYHAQCDTANPNGHLAGTAFYGGPGQTGPFDGLQAEYARIPFANTDLVKLPDDIDDDRAILLSDIYPTGYFGADLAEIVDGDTVAVFGAGPVGQFAIVSARQMGAERILVVDDNEDRLEMARVQGAEVINFGREHPVEMIRELTGGIGVDRVIDAVGVDAHPPRSGPAAGEAEQQADRQKAERDAIAEGGRAGADVFAPGDAPNQALEWSVQAVAKAGTLGIIGVYPPTDHSFPIGQAMQKNLTINMGNCNHRKYLPHLVELVRSNSIDPLRVLTRVAPMTDVLEAYRTFDQARAGWMKVEVVPGM